jgi:hypothetical protein
MSHPATITATVFEKILAFLTPLFLVAATSDPGAAREAADAILGSYGARTDRELRFAALSIAFGFGALDALSRSANPALVLNQVIRLRANANALNRAAQQNESRLEKLHKQPPLAAEAEDPANATQDAPANLLPANSATADLLAFARSKLKSMIGSTTPAAPAPAPIVLLSRQQRRDVERKAEKVRQRHQEDARRTARAERLSATRGPIGPGV